MKWPDDFVGKIVVGDCHDVLRKMPDGCIQCCVTSPPYWGLRDYGVEGQLGLEKTPEEFVKKMVAVFGEVRRVLRDDGTLWINFGDSYNAAGRDGHGTRQGYKQGTNRASANGDDTNRPTAPSLKPKDLIGIPWRVAFALQADGWYLRSDIIWAKPNPMPESVTDRPTKAHEYIFLMAKSERYFYNAEAIKEPGQLSMKMPDGWDTGIGAHGSYHRNGREKGRKTDKQRGHSRRHAGFNERWDSMSKEEQSASRNKRDVWNISTAPFPEAHFATFPPKLIEPCILAGCSKDGIVLDPFMGAGTVALVAAKHSRRFVGIELNPEYATMARKRIKNEISQGKLF